MAPDRTGASHPYSAAASGRGRTRKEWRPSVRPAAAEGRRSGTGRERGTKRKTEGGKRRMSCQRWNSEIVSELQTRLVFTSAAVIGWLQGDGRKTSISIIYTDWFHIPPSRRLTGPSWSPHKTRYVHVILMTQLHYGGLFKTYYMKYPKVLMMIDLIQDRNCGHIYDQ